MNTSIRAEEILILMMYGVNLFTRPTLRKWNQSYEGWLYSNGLLRRVQWLEAQKYLLRDGSRGQWVWRLTAKGRAAVRAVTDPERLWSRKWDGWWRQLVFDLPVEQRRARQSLLRWLRQHRFGYLQDSVWISPDPVREIAQALHAFQDDAGSFTLLECRCVKGFEDAALVRAAWPLELVQDGYGDYLRFAVNAQKEAAVVALHPQRLFELLAAEHRQWSATFAHDPLLPRALCPPNYNGPDAWRMRQRLLRSLAAHFPRSP